MDTKIAVPPPVPSPVTIVDVDIPMGSLFRFMLRWAIASIPAVIVIGGVLAAVGGLASIVMMMLFGVLDGLAR